ncbi:MAG: hypothetical protein Q7V57_19770 [Actinomycetota bacterium]|nr:hypothetical protein [Actinomycetota bacterium]
MRPITRTALVLVAGLLAACDSGGNAAPATLDTVVSTASVPASTTTVASEASTTTVAATVPDGAVSLAADGPWTLVDSAPGVTDPGLVYLLMPGLWVYLPIEEDIEHGITWVLNDDDVPVIEAYLMARLTYFTAITTDPIDLDLEGWTRYYADGGEQYRVNLEGRRAQGQVGDLDVGVVLRPVVLGEDRSDATAIVFDCVLDGGVFRLPDGSLAAGSTPGVVPSGIGMRLLSTAEGWVIEQVGKQPDACF